MDTNTLKVAVACKNKSGEADLYIAEVTCTEEQYLLGEHYDLAEEAAVDAGYEGAGTDNSFICYDHTEFANLQHGAEQLKQPVAPQEPQAMLGYDDLANTVLIIVERKEAEGIEFSGKTKEVTVYLSGFTRLEYSRVVKVPVEFGDQILNEELLEAVYDHVDGGDYVDDPNYWERGTCKVKPVIQG